MSAALNREVWEKLFAALYGNVIDGAVVPVAESTDPAQAFPYITIAVDFPDHGERKTEGAAQINVWTNGGTLQVLRIQAAVNALLDRQRLPIVGGAAVVLARSTPPIGRGEDGTTRHGVQIFSVLIHS